MKNTPIKNTHKNTEDKKITQCKTHTRQKTRKTLDRKHMDNTIENTWKTLDRKLKENTRQKAHGKHSTENTEGKIHSTESKSIRRPPLSTAKPSLAPASSLRQIGKRRHFGLAREQNQISYARVDHVIYINAVSCVCNA